MRTEDVFKSYGELEKKIGQPRFDVPPADAAPEVLKEFRTKMGVPETPEGYGLKAPDNIPEGAEYNMEMVANFAKTAHELGLTPAQAAGLQGWHDALADTIMKGDQEAKDAARLQADTELSEAFTKVFGSPEKATEAAATVSGLLKTAIPDEKTRAALEPHLNTQALQAIAMMHQHMAKTYGQSDTNVGDNPDLAGKSVDDLRKEAQAIMGTKEYTDPMDKGHADAKQKAQAIYQQIGALTDAAKKK